MIELLSRIWIQNRNDKTNPAVRTAYGLLCGCVGILLNLMLFGLKLFAGTISGSIAITADAYNNLSDAGSSIVTLLGFRLAGQKPDPTHPFGHGRIEYISGLIVAFLIVHVGIDLARESINKLRSPEPVEFSVVAVVILIVSILTKLYMCLYNRRVGRMIDSAAMHATAIDSLSDVTATSVVLIATVVGKLTGLQIDAWCGLGVSAFILYSGVIAAKDTISPLLGQAPDPEKVSEIRGIVLAHNEVKGIHDLIIHNYGPGRMMISLHAEVPSHADMLEMHDVIDTIEQELRAKVGCDAVVHMDPIVTDDAQTAQTFVTLVRMVASIDERLNLHDFRMVAGPTHTNLIFDLVVPYNFYISDEDLKRELTDHIREHNPTWFAVINIDKSYV
ncbi:MAG: cation diffusion facilitator family transporter [Clostridiaceae bacterium]|nr:cation diffusion facilitator family transporter [Clostridiaceae bacterium]